MHIHLDVLGGISGDMFIGSVLDCQPDLADQLPEVMSKAGFNNLVKLEHEEFNDGILTGTRFSVFADKDAESHEHRHYSEIKTILQNANLGPEVLAHTLGVFDLIAEAEAHIHGTTTDAVAFHEIGAWDSIADIVCAAWLIDQLGPATFSMSSLPLGRGRVKTAHGLLPVPAPATAMLLDGFIFHDDGVEGERITPTGAAILKYLNPDQSSRGHTGRLRGTGHGFGTRKFPGLSNVLRLLKFSSEESPCAWYNDEVALISFEIDDQTAEELAIGLERIRQQTGVLDVQQGNSIGKKNRQMATIQILALPQHQNDVISMCFDATSTIGIRTQLVNRSILAREHLEVPIAGHDYRVKRVQRPGGVTAKVEIDDLAPNATTQDAMRTLRHAIEHTASPTKKEE